MHSPVLVKAPLAHVTEMLGKHSGEWPQSARRLNIPNHTHHHYGRRLKDGHRLHHLNSGNLYRRNTDSGSNKPEPQIMNMQA